MRFKLLRERVLAITRKGRERVPGSQANAAIAGSGAADEMEGSAAAPAVHDSFDTPPLPEPPAARDSAAGWEKRDTETVWQLCARGATLAQIAEQTRIAAADVARHLGNLRRAGRELDVARLLGTERVEAIRAAAHGANGDVAAVRRRLPFMAPLATA